MPVYDNPWFLLGQRDTGSPYKQGDFALRYTGNYLDKKFGWGEHSTPLTFNEFLSKPEAVFMYEPEFFQIPGYVQQSAEIDPIEETARQFVVDYIMNEFELNILSMQDYVRWAVLFEHKCADICQSFWAQVNMINLMHAKDLEMDEQRGSISNTGNTNRLGGTTTTTDQNSESNTVGKVTSSQDTTNTQDQDSSTREATATVVRAEGQLTDEIKYPWSDSADNVHEVRSNVGSTKQHVEGETNSESTTNATAHSVSTVSMNNSNDQITNTTNSTNDYTNKQFMQERQWAIETARGLLPLTWLRAQLRPMFDMIY
jgi:hypothetical protein